jgi:hypothetical protein
LKTKAANGSFALGARVAVSLVRGVGPLDRGSVRRRREGVDHDVEQRADADGLRGGPQDHGDQLPFPDGRPEGLDHIGLGEGPLLEIPREEIVVGLRDGLHELLPRRLDGLGEIGGDVGLLDLPRRVAQDIALHPQDVHEPAEPGLLADRDVEWHEAPLEPALDRLERAAEVGPLAVHPVDEDQAGQPVLLGELRDLLRLDLDAGDRVHDQHRPLDHAEAGPRLGDEVAVSRHVDEVEPVLAVVAVRHADVDGDLSLDLLRIEIGGGGAVVHTAQTRRHAVAEQDCFDQRRLADPAVSDEADVTNARDIDGHRASRGSSGLEPAEPVRARRRDRIVARGSRRRPGGPVRR